MGAAETGLHLVSESAQDRLLLQLDFVGKCRGFEGGTEFAIKATVKGGACLGE